MKKLLIGLALLLAMGCGGKAIKKDVDLCDTVKQMPVPEQTITYDESEYQEFMYGVGLEMSWKMSLGHNPACAYVNVYRNEAKWHLMGEYCADLRDDGLYICEKACAWNADGEVVGKSQRCEKVTK